MKKLISLFEMMVEEVIEQKEIEKIEHTTLQNSGILESRVIQADIATLELEEINQLLKGIETKKVFLVQKRKSMISQLILENKKELLEKVKKNSNTIFTFYRNVLNKDQNFQFDQYKEELNEFYLTKSYGEKIIFSELLAEIFSGVEDEPLMKFAEKICSCESINEILGESDPIFIVFNQAAKNIKRKQLFK